MSQYSISASWVINIIGLRQVAGANISDPFKVIAPVSVFDTVANSKEHFRASISLSSGGNVQYITTNSSLTGPLGTAVAWSFVQMIAIRNTSNVETGGTLRVTFADEEVANIAPGAFFLHIFPMNEATQRGFDVSSGKLTITAVGAAATGELALVGNPSE